MRPPVRRHQPLSPVHSDCLDSGLAALIDSLAALAAEQYLAQVSRTNLVGLESNEQIDPQLRNPT